MDRERLTELLQDPAQVAAEDLGDLRSMTERFPWFSGAHLLLAVGEHAQGDVLSNDPVRTPAAYLPSRAVLFDLTQAEATPPPPPMYVVKDIQSEAPSTASPSVAKAFEGPPSVIEGPPSVAEETRPILPELPVEDLALATPAPREQPMEPSAKVEVPPPVIQGPIHVAEEMRPILSDHAIPGTESVAPQPAHAPSLPDTDPLESQMREAIMASGYDLSRIPTPPPIERMHTAAVPPLAIETAPPLAPPTASAPPVAQPIRSAARITKESRLRFTDWLTASDELSQEPLGEPVSSLSLEKRPSTSTPIPLAPLASEVLPDPKEIIERFIQQATPTATPVKAEFFTPQQAAKRSLLDAGLVSETLAKIYEKQGDIAKAKAAYARLAIIHPEKSVYFAALSKALEGRSNK